MSTLNLELKEPRRAYSLGQHRGPETGDTGQDRWRADWLRKASGVPLTALLFAAVALLPVPALAHGGGLNSQGCHTNSRTGDYHCHRAWDAPRSPARACERLHTYAKRTSAHALPRGRR